MSRKFCLSALCLVLVGLSVLVLRYSDVDAQEKNQQEKNQQEKSNSGKSDAGAEDEINAYLKASQPGPEHAKLKMRVGNWQVAGAFYMAPGAPPMQSKGTANIRPMMGGRYFRENYTGEFMGLKFTGMGISGYDKGLKKFVSTWIDSMSTGVMSSEGTASGDVISYVGEYFDPMRKQLVKTKSVLTLKSRKAHTITMYEFSEDGSERKVMELDYTRVKRGKNAKNAKSAKGGKNDKNKKEGL